MPASCKGAGSTTTLLALARIAERTGAQGRVLRQLRAFFGFALRERWIRRSFIEGTRKPKAAPRPTMPLSKDEMRALLLLRCSGSRSGTPRRAGAERQAGPAPLQVGRAGHGGPAGPSGRGGGSGG